MNNRFVNYFFLLSFLLFLGACDVVELVVYDKKVSVLREGSVSQNLTVKNEVSKDAILDSEAFIRTIDIPDGGKIDSVYLSSVTVKVLANDNNEVDEGQISVFASLEDGSKYLFIDNLVIKVGESNDVQGSKLDLDRLRKQLNQMYTSSDSTSTSQIEFTYFIPEKPGLELDWNINLEIGMNAQVTYCSSVPGDSELPDCE